MNRMLTAALVAAFLAPQAVPAVAGPIERACMTSPRKAKNRPLCNCIQRVANQTLSRSDQRKAAKFFKKPQMAQDIRMSDNRANERFWDRYTDFGATAAAVCG